MTIGSLQKRYNAAAFETAEPILSVAANPKETCMKSSAALTRFAAAVLLILLAALAVPMAGNIGYHLLKKYSFGAAEGATREYFDYINVDSSSRRVYLSHGTEIKVLNADTGALIGNISGLKQDHGVAVAQEFNRGFISDGAQGKFIIFDLASLKVIG